MAGRYKRWLVLLTLMAVILIALLNLTNRPPATVSAIALTFLGYTNPPGNNTRFALLSVSNQAPYTVKWYGDWVEVEGVPEHKGRTGNLPIRQPNVFRLTSNRSGYVEINGWEY
jgi:hypothetical protein